MSVPFEHSFCGKSVLVTGHTGFKGSWLCLWLHRLGAEVTGYALEPPTQPNNFTVSRIRDLLAGHHEADVRDRATFLSALEACQPDVVLHLAAQSVVRESYRTPWETFETNVMGTATVLECVRQLGSPMAVVCVTSDKCYENVEQVWGYRESDAMGEHDPYGGSKGAAELAIRSYRHSFFPPSRIAEHGVKIASGRAGNVIGGGDWTKDALIVDVFKALLAGEPVRIRSPHALRPWQHVLQALSGYLTLAGRLLEEDSPQLCSGWNFGPLPGNELRVRDVVESFLAAWGEGAWIDASDPNQVHEATILRLAVDKAIWQLDWQPRWNVHQALEAAARWYRCYAEGSQDLQELGLQQIEEYELAATDHHLRGATWTDPAAT